tara:strand:- start:3643 stop:4011 length:369 start_codon:yes stop_codon:yes gene_type:complete
MIEEKVIEKLKGKTWTFDEISQVNVLIEKIQEEIYDDLDAKEKLDLVWTKEIPGDGRTFGEFFKANVDYVLSEQIAIIIKEQLQEAKINFNEDDKDEISERSVGGKSPAKRTTNEKTSSKKS